MKSYSSYQPSFDEEPDRPLTEFDREEYEKVMGSIQIFGYCPHCKERVIFDGNQETGFCHSCKKSYDTMSARNFQENFSIAFQSVDDQKNGRQIESKAN